MPYVIGMVLALAVSVYASGMRLDRDRAFYPTVLIVVALYYVLFAVMGGGARAIVVESLIASAFVLAASLGFIRHLWLVAAALVGHGVLDACHRRVVANAGVPVWWPAFCMAYDVVAGMYLAANITPWTTHGSWLRFFRHRTGAARSAESSRAPSAAQTLAE